MKKLSSNSKKLSPPLVLTRMEAGEIFFLYITTSKEMVKIVMIIERNGKQKLVYYTIKVLYDVEMRYQKIEKLAYVIVLAPRKLKPYF